MSVYYLKGQSNSGTTSGITGYYYPLYTDESLISGPYHSHTFTALDNEVFYMPSNEMNHGVENPPSDTSYGDFMYQEYATYNVDNTIVSYTNISTAQSQPVIAIAATVDTFDPFNTNIANTESLRVEELIPEQLRASSEDFISLIKDYYEYLNTEGLPTYETNRIVDEHDIDEVSNKYLDGIQGEIAKNIPNSAVMDRVSLYKRIIQYYSLKGSEESITTFFRLFFDEVIKVSYPRERLFELSAGNFEKKNSEFTQTFTASVEKENLRGEFNQTGFQLIDDANLVLGAGNIVSVEETVKYDTAPTISSLVIDLNTKKNLNPINLTWDSVLFDKTIRGYFYQGAVFNESQELVKLDGKFAYLDFGDIGENPRISLDTEEHSFVIRTLPRYTKENRTIQPLFSLAKDYESLHSHELFFNKNTNKLGRSFVDIGEPLIAASDDSPQSLVFSNFIDGNTIFATPDDQLPLRKNHLNSFISSIGYNYNGRWQKTLIEFNGQSVYVHETDPVLDRFTADDLSFYKFDENTSSFDGPNNLQIGSSIYGESTNDFSGVNAISEDGFKLAIGASKNDGGGKNSGSVRVYELSQNSPLTWSQVGGDIDGDSSEDLLGSDLSLSADGSVLAIGAPEDKDSTDAENSRGEVKIFELTSSPGTWVQKGSSIVGSETIEDSKLGASVSLNGAGDRVAIGSGADPNIDYDIGTQDEDGILLEDFNGFTTTHNIKVASAAITSFVYNGNTYTKTNSTVHSKPTYSFTDESGPTTYRIEFEPTAGSGLQIGWVINNFQSAPGNISASLGDTDFPFDDINGDRIADYTQLLPANPTLSFSSDGTIATIAVGGEFDAASTHVYVSGVSHQYDGLFEISSKPDTSTITYVRSGPAITSNSFTIETGTSPQFGADDGGKHIGDRFTDRALNEVVVYEYSNSAWSQIGTNITEPNNDPLSGTTVRLSNDGRILIVGTHKINEFDEILMSVKAYFNKEGTTSWTQLGTALQFIPQARLNRGKIPLSLSNDGRTLAVGILGDRTQEGYKGEVKIYSLNNQDKWVQFGQTLEGENINDDFGSSVALNTNGDVIVIGAPDNDENGNNSGHVQTFSYQSTLQTWQKVGATIQGFGDTGNAGESVSINGTGTRVVVGSPENDQAGENRGKVDVFQVAINATIGTFIHAEKNPLDTTSRWSIKNESRISYYSDWESDITTVNPYDIGTKWIKSSKPGDASLPVLPHCEYVKNNNDHLFTLHNRGYLSIYYKHNGEYTPWQDITIGDTTLYGEERLWDILDYAVHGTHLVLLDRPVKAQDGRINDGASRLVIFKLDEYNQYNFHQTVSLNLPATHVGSADFAHVKINNARIVVGTHTFNNVDIAQIIQVYTIGRNNSWSTENYLTLPNTYSNPPEPDIEFDISKKLVDGQWSSTSGLIRFRADTVVANTLKDTGVIFRPPAKSVGSGIRLDVSNKFAISLRFKTRDRFESVDNILSIGNITLRIVRDNLVRKLQIISQESGKPDQTILLDKIDTNIILDDNPLEIFSDEYFNSQIKRSTWNNLIVEFTANENNIITGLRYALNGFKRSKFIDFEDSPPSVNVPVHGITQLSQFTLHNDIAFSHLALYNKELTHIEFEAIERNLSSNYTETVTTGINSLLDGGKFEINETGSVIIKVTNYGINIWEKITDAGWKNYYNTFESVTNTVDSYITHNGSRLYSYKFFGDDFLIATGGLNNAKQFVDQYNFSNVYNKVQHNSQAKLYYIESQYTTAQNTWKVKHELTPSIPFVQTNDDDFRIGLNYGVNIAIDNKDESFAISLEPNSANKILNGPTSTFSSTENATNVKYDVYKKISETYIRLIPFAKPEEGYSEVSSYGGRISNSAVLKIVDRSPSYNAVFSYPHIIHTTSIEKPMIEYVYTNDETTVGYYKNSTEYSPDFVVSTAPSSEVYANNQTVTTNEFQTIILRGRADRYNGYIEISTDDNNNYERIISGNTLRHLTISPESNFVLGRNGVNGSNYYNGDISHSQYYVDAISNASTTLVKEFIANNVKKFYKIVFDRIRGTASGATKVRSIPGANHTFQFTDLDGHSFNSFLRYEEPEFKIDTVDESSSPPTIIPAENTGLIVTVDYGNSITGEEVVYWGDGRLNTLLNNAPAFHRWSLEYVGEYTNKKGRLSSTGRIQDSNFWQKFSYNIQSGLRVDNWEDVFLNLVHPAGLKFFASVILLVIRDNHWYGPKSILFDTKTRQNVNLLRIEEEFLSPFRTKQPLEDMRWLESLVAPSDSGGYHLPIFQPGWLQGDIRVRRFIFEAGLWTQLARSVPGNNLASKYTYSYFENGSESGDIEFRLLTSSGDTVGSNPGVPFEVGDIVSSGADTPDPNDTNSPARSLQKRGIISSISPAGVNSAGVMEYTGVIKSFSIYDSIYADPLTSTIDIEYFGPDSPARNTLATITTTKVKRRDEVMDVYGTEEQEAAYLLQDRSTEDINSEMFMRAVLMVFKYVIPSLVSHKDFTKNDYEQNLKFKDEGGIGPYLDLTIKGALSERDVFINVSSLIRKRNQLSTESGDGIYLESDSSPFGVDEGILLDDIVNFYNDPTNDYDVSSPVDFNINSFSAGSQLNHGDRVYQDIVNDAGDNLTIEGLIVATSNSGNTISIAWRGAINTSKSPDVTLPSNPELDQLFRTGEIYTVVDPYSSPPDNTQQTVATVTIST
tara:strand:- start:4432 stop:12453 length:8022 start_codon:yes stop_codon:yes gene_type:complete